MSRLKEVEDKDVEEKDNEKKVDQKVLDERKERVEFITDYIIVAISLGLAIYGLVSGKLGGNNVVFLVGFASAVSGGRTAALSFLKNRI